VRFPATPSKKTTRNAIFCFPQHIFWRNVSIRHKTCPATGGSGEKGSVNPFLALLKHHLVKKQQIEL
jgi:hypothetical protein